MSSLMRPAMNNKMVGVSQETFTVLYWWRSPTSMLMVGSNWPVRTNIAGIRASCSAFAQMGKRVTQASGINVN